MAFGDVIDNRIKLKKEAISFLKKDKFFFHTLILFILVKISLLVYYCLRL